MDLEKIAHSILFGDRWEDKLLFASDFYDYDDDEADRTPLIQAPRFPGRPQKLRLLEKADRAKTSFPKLDELAEETSRGRLLHFFANHELLAMELMALMLLKFPDAPKSFRAGIARTIFEEQNHLKLYVDRMRELGVDFGELPVSDYFWNAMKDMSSPLQFVTQMSLTLEQANLDFSLFYRNAVAAVGDTETAAILERVYQEEIGHVKHGLTWFNRWRQPVDAKPELSVKEDDWDAYLRLLPPPMTPIRAKGLSFSIESRRQAGFSERFIRELEVHGGSKGRPPVFWLYNPLCDSEIARGKPGLTPSEPVRKLSLDLEHLPMHLALEQDVILVRELPRIEWLKEMREAGFTIPEFRVLGKPGEMPRENKIGGLNPWGWSPEPFELFKPWRKRLIRVDGTNHDWCGSLLDHETFPEAEIGKLFSKSWSAQYLREWLVNHPEDEAVFGSIDNVGETFSDWESAREKLQHALSRGENWIAKAPFGTSGTQNKRITSCEELESTVGAWIRKIIDTQNGIILEPWLDKQVDLSIQIEIGSGSTHLLGIRQFMNGEHLEYRGTSLDPKLGTLPQEILRFLHESPSPLERWRGFARKLGEKLREENYQGPAGLDAMVWKDRASGKLFLKPLVELNPRWTMGRVALEIEKHVVPGVPARWIFLPVRELSSRRLPELPAEAAKYLQERYPLKLDHGKNGIRITEGIVFTTDPERARAVLTALVVGENVLA